MCYYACVKSNSDVTMSKKAFTDAMKVLPWENIIFFYKEYVLKWVEDHLPGLPE